MRGRILESRGLEGEGWGDSSLQGRVRGSIVRDAVGEQALGPQRPKLKIFDSVLNLGENCQGF